MDDWPESDIIVVTDFLSLQNRLDAERILSHAVSRCRWLVIRNGRLYKRGKFSNDHRWVTKHLEGLSAGRRKDLEKVARSKFHKDFNHEIWQTQESWEEVLIPEGFE